MRVQRKINVFIFLRVRTVLRPVTTHELVFVWLKSSISCLNLKLHLLPFAAGGQMFLRPFWRICAWEASGSSHAEFSDERRRLVSDRLSSGTRAIMVAATAAAHIKLWPISKSLGIYVDLFAFPATKRDEIITSLVDWQVLLYLHAAAILCRGRTTEIRRCKLRTFSNVHS